MEPPVHMPSVPSPKSGTVQYEWTRSTAVSVPRWRAPRHTVRQQVVAPGCRTPTERTLHVVLCNDAVVPRSHSCVRVCCCYPRPHRDRHPHYRPLSQNFSRKLLCFRLSESVGESPPASSTTQLIIPLSTQPV